MSYTMFGGGPADVTTDAQGTVVGGVPFEVWTAPTGGLRVTDLLTPTGEPLPGRVTSQADTADPADRGRIRFQAPAAHQILYLDRGYGDRWQVTPTTLGQTVATAISRSETALTQAEKAVTDATTALAVSRAQVDVRTYGAIGDGLTDDTPAFRAALAELDSRGGGVLYVPPLEYRIAGHIPLIDNLSIEGWGARLVKHTGSQSSYAYFSALSDGTTGYGSGCDTVRVAGITFTGDFASDRTTCGFGLHHARNVIIEQCHFWQVQGNGHCIDLAGCDTVTIRQCTFTGFKEAAEGSVYRRTEAIQIDTSTNGSLSVQDAPGSFDGLHTRNVVVEDCDFETLTLGLTEYPAPNPLGSHTKREGAVAENVVFRRNRVARLTVDRTSPLRGGIHFTGIRGLTLEANTIICPANTRVLGLYVDATGTPASADPNTTGVAQTTIAPLPVENITITGNTIIIEHPDTVNVDKHIHITGTTAQRARNVTIAGNRMRFAETYGWALSIEHVDGLRVTDNQGDGIHIGIIVTTGSDVVSARNAWRCAPKTPQSYSGQSTEQYRGVAGLTVDACQHVNPLDPAVWVGDASSDVTITNQVIINPKQTTANRGDGIRIAGAQRFTVTGNKITTDNTTAKAYGVEVYGTTSKGLITGNIITGYTAQANLNGLTTVTASGNI